MSNASSVNEIVSQINALTGWLIEQQFSDDQNFAFPRELPDGSMEVVFEGSRYVSAAMKNRTYVEIYNEFTVERVYNVKMLDGGLIQMLYHFRNNEIVRHRLAMFPSPNLDAFQNEPELYMDDEIYADVVARNVMPIPLRFDFDTTVDPVEQPNHSISHLTLGQFENCRIPVSSALTPFWFVHFILRNFYNSAYLNSQTLPTSTFGFPECIRREERAVAHLVIPNC